MGGAPSKSVGINERLSSSPRIMRALAFSCARTRTTSPSRQRQTGAPAISKNSREQNVVFCSHRLCPVNRLAPNFRMRRARFSPLTPALFDQRGNRKYLIARGGGWHLSMSHLEKANQSRPSA